MSAHLELAQELESLTNGALLDLLHGLEAEERALSGRRHELHELLAATVDADLLDALRREENEVSEGRLQLHLQITQLRIERGNRVRRLRSQLSAVE